MSCRVTLKRRAAKRLKDWPVGGEGKKVLKDMMGIGGEVGERGGEKNPFLNKQL